MLSDQFATVLDEASGIYLKHCSETDTNVGDAPTKAVRAIKEAMTKLMEEALSKERRTQDKAMVWAQPMLEEMRSLDQTLDHHATLSKSHEIDDPLACLREARSELVQVHTALSELDEHTTNEQTCR